MKLEPFPEAKPKIETEFKPFSRGVKFESAEEKGFQVNDNLHRATENDRKEFGSLKIKTKSEGISSFVKVEENADVKIACKLETSKIEPKTERISTASLKVDGDTIGTFKIERKPDGVSSDKAEDEASPFMLPSQGLAVDEVLPMPMEVDRDGGRADLETRHTPIVKLEENDEGLDTFEGEAVVPSTISGNPSNHRRDSLTTQQPQCNTLGLGPNPSSEQQSVRSESDLVEDSTPRAVKREIEVDQDILTMPAPRKRPRLFMEAVEITISAKPTNTPSVSTALERSKLLTPAVLDQVKKLSNSIVKVKKEKELTLESLVYRLNAVGLDSYPISLSDEIRKTTVERLWLSKHYGGAPQGGSPPIDRKQFKHKMIFRFFDSDFSSHLPKNPGDPGLTFYGVGEAGEWRPDAEDVFIKLKPSHWLYIGMYRMFVSKSLTAEEWTQQSAAFKALWCRTIRNRGGGSGSRPLRILLDLRRRLGREPTAAERKKALRSGSDRDIELTDAEIDAGFQRGTGKIAVWAMKCVGYREDFQRNIWGRVPTGWER